MTEADRKDFSGLLADVLGFYRQPVSVFAMTVWWEACKEFDLQAISRAMTAHAKDPERGQFCPLPADVTRHLRSTSRDEALMAWQRVLGQVGPVGRYGAPKLSEPESAALQAIGGWLRLCNSQTDELGHLAREFCANFSAVESVQRRQLVLGAPAGAARLAAASVGQITSEDRDAQ